MSSIGPSRPLFEANDAKATKEEKALAFVRGVGMQPRESESEKPQRGKWMTELPALKNPGSVLSNRSFSKKGVLSAQDDSWTRVPGEEPKVKGPTTLSIQEKADRERNAALAQAFHEARKQEKSLVEEHLEKQEKEGQEEDREEDQEEEKGKRRKRRRRKGGDVKEGRKRRSKGGRVDGNICNEDKDSGDNDTGSREKKKAPVPTFGPGSFDRERDVGGRQVKSHTQLRGMVKEATALRSNFTSGTFL